MGKLVRDKIPDIIKAAGKRLVVHTAATEEYERSLLEKLREEAEEYIEARNEEELADILEVVHALCKHYGYRLQDIESKRAEKKEMRGGFDGRIVLDRVD